MVESRLDNISPLIEEDPFIFFRRIPPKFSSLRIALYNLMQINQISENRGIYCLFPDPDSEEDFFLAGVFSEASLTDIRRRYCSNLKYWKRFDQLQERFGLQQES